jgi:hypothetical protein
LKKASVISNKNGMESCPKGRLRKSGKNPSSASSQKAGEIAFSAPSSFLTVLIQAKSNTTVNAFQAENAARYGKELNGTKASASYGGRKNGNGGIVEGLPIFSRSICACRLRSYS